MHRLLSGHTKAVDCVAVGDLDGRPVAVTGGYDGTARVWDLASQRQIGDPLPVGIAVSAVAVGDLGDYTVALTGGQDGIVRAWDLSAGQEYGQALIGHTNRVNSIVVGALDGRPVALTGSADGTARVWDLVGRRQLGTELTAHRRTVRDVDLGELDGRPIAVTGGEDKAVYIWDLSELSGGGDARPDGSPLIGPAGAVTAVCLARLDGHTNAVRCVRFGELNGASVVVGGGEDGTVRRWDLRSGEPVGEPVEGHETGAYGLELVRSKGRSAIVSGMGKGRLRFSGLADGADLGVELDPFPALVRAIRVADVNGAPILVAADRYGLLRVWDMRSASWNTEIDLGSGVNGIALDGDGSVCAATDMGLVALRLHGTGHEGEETA